MHDLGVLPDLVLIVGLAIPVVAAAHRLRLPTLVGFLLVGVLIGPDGLAFIRDADQVAALAEIGVEVGDTAVLVGDRDALDRAAAMFRSA